MYGFVPEYCARSQTAPTVGPAQQVLSPQQNIHGAAASITSARGRVCDHMAAHPPRAQPFLDVLFQHRVMLERVAPASVNDADACISLANGSQDKILHYNARIIEVEPMQIHVGLDRKSARSQIV